MEGTNESDISASQREPLGRTLSESGIKSLGNTAASPIKPDVAPVETGSSHINGDFSRSSHRLESIPRPSFLSSRGSPRTDQIRNVTVLRELEVSLDVASTTKVDIARSRSHRHDANDKKIPRRLHNLGSSLANNVPNPDQRQQPGG